MGRPYSQQQPFSYVGKYHQCVTGVQHDKKLEQGGSHMVGHMVLTLEGWLWLRCSVICFWISLGLRTLGCFTFSFTLQWLLSLTLACALLVLIDAPACRAGSDENHNRDEDHHHCHALLICLIWLSHVRLWCCLGGVWQASLFF